MSENDKFKVMNQFNSVINRRVFAHHPACDVYDHHVVKVGEWTLCIGCLGVYPTLTLLIILHIFGIGYYADPVYSHLLIGILFFTPAILQLFWKTKRRLLKYILRVSLGISIFYLATFALFFPTILGKVLFSAIFIGGFVSYSKLQGKTQFKDCDSCPYGFQYETCIKKFDYILNIENLELIADISPRIEYFAQLKQLRDIGDLQIKI